MTPLSKANVENLASFGIRQTEFDTSTRKIKLASPEKPALFQIHTDTSMKLRIRLLENPSKPEPNLLHEMYIYPEIHTRPGVGNKPHNPRDFRDLDFDLEFLFIIWDLIFILGIWNLGLEVIFRISLFFSSNFF